MFLLNVHIQKFPQNKKIDHGIVSSAKTLIIFAKYLLKIFVLALVEKNKSLPHVEEISQVSHSFICATDLAWA